MSLFGAHEDDVAMIAPVYRDVQHSLDTDAPSGA